MIEFGTKNVGSAVCIAESCTNGWKVLQNINDYTDTDL